MSTVEEAKRRIGDLESILKSERDVIDIRVKEAIENERKKTMDLQRLVETRDVTAG
jgi:hypothetical protein